MFRIIPNHILATIVPFELTPEEADLPAWCQSNVLKSYDGIPCDPKLQLLVLELLNDPDFPDGLDPAPAVLNHANPIPVPKPVRPRASGRNTRISRPENRHVDIANPAQSAKQITKVLSTGASMVQNEAEEAEGFKSSEMITNPQSSISASSQKNHQIKKDHRKLRQTLHFPDSVLSQVQNGGCSTTSSVHSTCHTSIQSKHGASIENPPSHIMASATSNFAKDSLASQPPDKKITSKRAPAKKLGFSYSRSDRLFGKLLAAEEAKLAAGQATTQFNVQNVDSSSRAKKASSFGPRKRSKAPVNYDAEAPSSKRPRLSDSGSDIKYTRESPLAGFQAQHHAQQPDHNPTRSTHRQIDTIENVESDYDLLQLHNQVHRPPQKPSRATYRQTHTVEDSESGEEDSDEKEPEEVESEDEQSEDDESNYNDLTDSRSYWPSKRRTESTDSDNDGENSAFKLMRVKKRPGNNHCEASARKQSDPAVQQSGQLSSQQSFTKYSAGEPFSGGDSVSLLSQSPTRPSDLLRHAKQQYLATLTKSSPLYAKDSTGWTAKTAKQKPSKQTDGLKRLSQENKSRGKKRGAWTEAEHMALQQELMTIRDNERRQGLVGILGMRDEDLWGHASSALLVNHSIDRSMAACKNYWSRGARERCYKSTGFDERAIPNPTFLSTSVQKTKGTGQKR